MTLYKVTNTDGRSRNGGTGRWQKGRWRGVRGDLVACERGLHLCREGDLIHWLGPVIWEAEVDPSAKVIEQGDKIVVSRARVIKRLETWNERTARLFAADCAEHALTLTAENDPRSFEAVAVARRYAEGEASEYELSAARSAAGSAAVSAARLAAGSAAESAAYSAARAAARAAAWSAAYSAARAAAWSAAYSAARAAVREWQTRRLMEYLRGDR